MFARLHLVLFSLLMLLGQYTFAVEQTSYKVENIKDNIYRFSAGHYHSAFMIVDKVALVTDPLNSDAAQYLKSYIKKTFNADIKYMVYSHSHVDHAMGGNELIDKNTTVVSHKFAADDLRLNKVPTALPDLTFSDTLTLNLGESYVVLNYYGPNNGRGNVSMRFMPANVLYVVDWIVLGRMPYKNLIGYDINGMLSSTKAILNEPPFAVFIGGHADTGNRDDVVSYLHYIEDLHAAVRDGMLAGKKLSTLQKEITLEKYSHLKMYQQWLPLNIESVYNNLVEMGYFNFRSDIDAQF
ncbi:MULTISPECIES: MBL fold metallo-hydrolase [unclassified Pseudoalteromonas]|uniref:MBL fold metallo-hydrolase n=1 Tax=unclassified Pseudoalteromonas TaxID=194690 RepID=UPI0018F4DF8C|nr:MULTISPECIES: MBL fold metallo-hydrolase [unclassified Pseudoalteromonas]MCC9660989.1 MBL fold metallo-hydrolase [Pseudoalteromonas sp. MB41]